MNSHVWFVIIQIALRDYPHSRHLCLKFPFKTTPSESYCEKVREIVFVIFNCIYNCVCDHDDC